MNLSDIVAQVAQTIQKEANINAVFGEPKKLDEHTIVPVARVTVTLGVGGAGARGQAKQEGQSAEPHGEVPGGTGGGGGLQIEVRPIGFVRDTPNGAEFVAIEPVAEGVLGKVEHLLEGLRGRKPKPGADE